MYQEVIDFWFNEIDKSQWFKTDDDFDRLVKTRFLDIHSKAIRCELFSWRCSSLGVLAEIIVLDQFSRNMYRGEPESFSYDLLALALAQCAITAGHDLELSLEQRSFIYMPFMHSESLHIHQEATDLFTKLGNAATLEFEGKHKAIIEKFGRYPHRNSILDRVSTQEEIEFLTQANSSF